MIAILLKTDSVHNGILVIGSSALAAIDWTTGPLNGFDLLPGKAMDACAQGMTGLLLEDGIQLSFGNLF